MPLIIYPITVAAICASFIYWQMRRNHITPAACADDYIQGMNGMLEVATEGAHIKSVEVMLVMFRKRYPKRVKAANDLQEAIIERRKSLNLEKIKAARVVA